MPLPQGQGSFLPILAMLLTLFRSKQILVELHLRTAFVREPDRREGPGATLVRSHRVRGVLSHKRDCVVSGRNTIEPKEPVFVHGSRIRLRTSSPEVFGRSA